MSYLTQLKDRLFNRRLAADAKPPTKPEPGERPVSLESAKQIIILFPLDGKDAHPPVANWKAANRKAKRTIKLVGYTDKPVAAEETDVITIGPKEINWFGLPKGPMTDRFLAEDCDLLIRLGPARHRQLDYLAATKRAAVKVGPYDPEHTPIYQLQFDGRAHQDLAGQLTAIEAIFSFTNAKPT